MESKVCLPRILKNVSYVIAPIIVIMLLIIVVCVFSPIEREAIRERVSFAQTKEFAEQYAAEILSAFSTIKNYQAMQYYSPSYDWYVAVENVKDNEQIEKIYYFDNYSENNVKWLIIDKKTKEAFTNIEYGIDSTTFEEVKNKVDTKNIFWNFNDSNVETSINKLKNINYMDNRLEERSADASNYIIYTSLAQPLESLDNIYWTQFFYNILLAITPNAIYIIPVLVILLIVLVSVIVVGIGKKRGVNGIALNWFDKMLIEIAFLIAIMVGVIGLILVAIILDSYNMITFIIGMGLAVIGIIITYLACILLFETIIKRIKTHTFVKTTFAYWVYIQIRDFAQNMKITNNFLMYFIIYILSNALLIGITIAQPLIGIILLAVFNWYVYKIASDRIKSYNKIKNSINELYNGKTNLQLNQEEFTKTDRQMAYEINNIAGGFSNAIDEKLKSEKLKTELITNVSHDIKTPLTSIINYVDLLKKENIEGEKANEYLSILDNKSQRLKKLTEDLVEASKASAGAIKLNFEKLNINELIKQVSGEFEDKFKTHNLQEIITLPEKEVYIKADSRYLYRVLENMYSNIAKYALEGTRVYIDITEKDNKVYIELKNVSKQKLNISADELMQRFVRGEASRNTEGSGLGLSIAKSLTELQKGKFNIYLDGDLFKVTIEFAKEE